MNIKSESFLMKFFKKIGLDSIAWSLRRLYCPVKKDDLVLEVGSGGNPYFRANALCDAYFETAERHFEPLIYDRSTVLAFIENLPFKDNAFNFIIASHVLEHSTNPDKFLLEIQRVARAGYIETPSAFFERICSYPMHRLEIEEEGGELVIYKKTAPVEDTYLNNLFSKKASKVFPEWVSKRPFHFNIRYYWMKDNGGIRYKIINPEYKFDWELPVVEKSKITPTPFVALIKKFILFIVRKLFSQNLRNKRIKITDYLICLKCRQSNFENKEINLKCKNCGKIYPILKGEILDFTG